MFVDKQVYTHFLTLSSDSRNDPQEHAVWLTLTCWSLVSFANHENQGSLEK